MRTRFIALAVLALPCLAAWGQQETPAAVPPTDPTQVVSKEGEAPVESKSPSLDLRPGPDGTLSQEQMEYLFRVVADKDFENDKRQRNYAYVERDVQRNVDGKGHVKSTEIKTYDVLEVAGEQVQRLIEKNDKPLDAREAAKEDEKIQKIIDKRKNESEGDRQKREKKEEKEHEDSRKFVTEVANAYTFKLLGTEMVDGREAWVIAAEPRAGFEPHMKEAKFLSKIHGRVWIDKSDLQFSKMDVEMLDTISFGLVLARIHKGTRVMLEQTRVNDEVWLPKKVDFKVDARLALLKGYKIVGEQTYRDYKKFRTSTKIVGMGEVKDPPANFSAQQPQR